MASNLLQFPVRLSGDMSGGTGVNEDAMPDVVSLHLRHLELLGHTPASIYSRRRALARLWIALGKPLLDADAVDLLAWRVGLSVGPATICAYVSHARAFYRWAAAEGLIDISPAERLPVPKVPRRIPRPIGDRALFAAVAGAPDRIRPWLALAGWCGLRAREIALLRRECILETRMPPLLLVGHDATKGHADRLVPLHDFALGELLEHGLPRAGWVFKRYDGLPGPNRPWVVSHLSNAYLHKAGHPETLHQLRHRFATSAYTDSRDLRMVQELLGHAHPQTTALYAAWDQSEAAAVVARIPAPGHLKLLRSTETEKRA